MVRIVVIAVLIGTGLLAEDASVARATSTRSVPEYQTGQAARLVLGQSSFTSREGRISATSLVYAGGNLFATEQVSSQQYRVHVFNVASLPLPKAEVSAAREDACPVCGFMPSLDVDEQAPPDSPAIAERDDARVVADIPNRRVLIWH
ncbi:MAG TPA: hypothetical protein VH325_00475, partial [Bryobacteraceae bacterium]|nr:hypothetical protein [Bryobacteraceae bacterium]